MVSGLTIERVLAPNPGPFTGPGTNTWVVSSGGEAIVIDPGPLIASHEREILQAIARLKTVAVIVTHGHEDHAPLANPLARDLGVAAHGSGPAPDFKPDLLLDQDSSLDFGGQSLRVVETPGHSDDHLCFRIDRVLFSGDHIMGGSSVMVEDLSSYLDSLRKLQHLELDRIYPGHGDEIEEPRETIDWYIAHRLQRESEILQAIADGALTVEEIVEVVYAGVDPALHPLAAISVAAHLRKLEESGPG